MIVYHQEEHERISERLRKPSEQEASIRHSQVQGLSFPFERKAGSRFRRFLKHAAINLSLVAASFLFVGLLLETVVFKYVFIPSDMPEMMFQDGVIKQKPFQTGVYRVQDDVRARYTINANGWNSGHPQYLVPSTGRTRIAVIGDSYIQALQVAPSQSIAERLETMLGPDRFEVYRFGISGAPMSQYLQMLRQEVLAYQPDMVIVLLIHNDFDESYNFVPGTYTSSFLKLKLDDDKVVGEIQPSTYVRPWYNFIRETNTWKYLRYRRQLAFANIRKQITGQSLMADGDYQANVSVSTIKANTVKNIAAARYVLSQIKEECDNHGIRLAVMMDGDRQSIYRNISDESVALTMNHAVSALARDIGIDFIDLHQVFSRDYAIHHQHFEFSTDMHWNDYAHLVAAQALYQRLRATAYLDLPPLPSQQAFSKEQSFISREPKAH